MRRFIYSPPSAAPEIIFQDEHYVAINKASGLLSNPGIDPLTHDCAVSRIEQALGPVYLVHRLDCDTSGVLVMAKTKPAESALKKQLQEREVDKTYVALVWGMLSTEEGVVDAAIGPNPSDRPLQQLDRNGKRAVTGYRVLSESEDKTYSRVQLNPETGRTHQLRVHMASLGHPILGDSFYAEGAALAAAKRLCLHAETLRFKHFATGQQITLHAKAPF